MNAESLLEKLNANPSNLISELDAAVFTQLAYLANDSPEIFWAATPRTNIFPEFAEARIKYKDYADRITQTRVKNPGRAVTNTIKEETGVLDAEQNKNKAVMRARKRAIAAVADFYVLNYAWFWTGAGQQAYGYPMTDEAVKVPDAIRKKIDVTFKSVTHQLAIGLVDAGERSVRCELMHAVPMTVPSQLEEWLTQGAAPDKADHKGNQFLREDYKLNMGPKAWTSLFPNEYCAKEFNPMTCSLAQARTIFSTGKWEAYFGGEPWAKACTELEQLVQTSNRSHTEQGFAKLIYEIDKFLDLQHNTGTLLSKTEFDKVDKEFLDLRAGAVDVGVLLPYCSQETQKLIKTVNRYVGLNLDKTQDKNYLFMKPESDYEVTCLVEETSMDAQIAQFLKKIYTKDVIEGVAKDVFKAEKYTNDPTLKTGGVTTLLEKIKAADLGGIYTREIGNDKHSPEKELAGKVMVRIRNIGFDPPHMSDQPWAKTLNKALGYETKNLAEFIHTHTEAAHPFSVGTHYLERNKMAIGGCVRKYNGGSMLDLWSYGDTGGEELNINKYQGLELKQTFQTLDEIRTLLIDKAIELMKPKSFNIELG
jgi:hypothetical protein